MSIRKLSILFLAFIGLSLNMVAQVTSESQARQELQKRGISESELRTALLAKGIDLDKIDPTNAPEFQRIQRIIEETVTELEKQKGSGAASAQVPDDVAKEGSLDNPTQPINSTPATPIAPVVIAPVDTKAPAPTTYPIYGQSVFAGGNMKVFNKVEDGRATGSYVLGPGDVVSISIWGASVLNSSQTIGKEGFIQPQGMPRLFLSGLTVTQAEKLTRSSYAQRAIFNTQDFSFTVVSPRNINVNIYGEVKVNGTFYLSALNTAFNALVATGGLTELASVRKITLQRAGEKPKSLDVYEFLSNPIIANDFHLQENDFLHVPSAEKLVTITGAVLRNGTYELLPNEKLGDLLKFAGGAKANALLSSIQLKRIENNAEKIIDIDYAELLANKNDLSLSNGDVISIKMIEVPVENIVNIEGAVYYPDQYAITAGTRLSEVLGRAQLRENALTNIIYLRRRNADKVTVRYELVNASLAITNPGSNNDPVLQNGDVVIIRSAADFANSGQASIAGAVKSEGSFIVNEADNFTLKDALFISGGLTENATTFGYITRTNAVNTTDVSYLYLDLSKEETLTTKINAGDIINIYTREAYSDQSKVQISGSVRSPNSYTYHPNLTLKDLIILSGGLRMDAAPNRVDVFRLKFRDGESAKTIATTVDLKSMDIFESDLDFKLEPFDIVVVRQIPEFSLQKSVTISGDVKYPGIYASLQKESRVSAIVKQAGGLNSSAYPEGATLFRSSIGYIVLELKDALANPGGPQDFILETGDLIAVPEKNSLVTIKGAVELDEVAADFVTSQGKIYVSYQGEKSAKYYIDQFAGGFKDNALRKKVTVQYQNGRVKKTTNFGLFKAYPKVKPGAIVSVPYEEVKPESVKTESEKKDIDWGEVLANSVSQATAVLSLILLLRAISN